MKKFVISWCAHGPYETDWYIECVLFESKEMLESLIYNSVLDFAKGKREDCNLRVGNTVFNLNNFILKKAKDKFNESDLFNDDTKLYYWITMPDIQTLEEWFSNKQQNIGD